MKSIRTPLAAIASALISLNVAAEIQTFEIDNLQNQAHMFYPGLDLTEVDKTTLKVSSDSENPDKTLNSLEIKFSDAGTLRAYGFKEVEHGKYRSLVKNAWVFNELVVEVVSSHQYFEDFTPVEVNVYVSEQRSALNPEQENTGPILFQANGELEDISPNPVADVASVTVNGKRATLKLKKNPGVNREHDSQRYSEGFILDTTWLGHGQKLVYLSGVNMPYDRIDAIGIDLESFPGPDGEQENRISVRYQDETGTHVTPSENIKELLEMAFPPVHP